MQKDMSEFNTDDYKNWEKYRRGESPVDFYAKQVHGRHWIESQGRLRRTSPGDYIIHNGTYPFIEQAGVFEKNYAPAK